MSLWEKITQFEMTAKVGKTGCSRVSFLISYAQSILAAFDDSQTLWLAK